MQSVVYISRIDGPIHPMTALEMFFPMNFEDLKCNCYLFYMYQM